MGVSGRFGLKDVLILCSFTEMVVFIIRAKFSYKKRMVHAMYDDKKLFGWLLLFERNLFIAISSLKILKQIKLFCRMKEKISKT